MTSVDHPVSHLLPEKSFLSDLRLFTKSTKGGAIARMPVVPEMLNDRGEVPAGILAILIDAVTGRLAYLAALPEIVATTHISLQSSRPAGTGPIFARGAILRRGRSNIALDVELLCGEEETLESFGLGCATFSIIGNPNPPKGRAATISTMNDEVDMSLPDSRLDMPFLEAIGLEIIDAERGEVAIALTPYVHNHMQVLQGGIQATLAQYGGELACRAATGAPVTALDLSIQYLSLARVGPFHSHTRVLRTTAASATARVDLYDTGSDNRLISTSLIICAIPA